MKTADLLPLLLVMLWAMPAHGASDSVPADFRPLTAVYHLGVGSTSALNTYLTPEIHRGTSVQIGGSWSRDLAHRPLRQTYFACFSAGFLNDRSTLSAMTDLGLRLGWNLTRKFSPLPHLNLDAGAGLMLDGGLLYLSRNSNNPVAARMSLALTLDAGASYKFNIGKVPLTIFERVSLPSLGVFFSPHYGQSYYEIYLGDHSGLTRCGWWGNHFMLSNMAGVEVPVMGIRLRVAYAFDMLSSLASGINTRITSHTLVVGISTSWLNVTRKSSAAYE